MKSNLFKEIPIKILLALKDKSNKGKNKSKIARKINCTNSHYAIIINRLENLGLLTSEKIGSGVINSLTKKGEAVTNKFILINKKLLKDNKTPAEKCGLHLNNPNKWVGLLSDSLENER